jgi:hypothetical protein
MIFARADPRDLEVSRKYKSSFGVDLMAFTWALPAIFASDVTRPRTIVMFHRGAFAHHSIIRCSHVIISGFASEQRCGLP